MIYNMRYNTTWFDPGQMKNLREYLEFEVRGREGYFKQKYLYEHEVDINVPYTIWIGLNCKPQILKDGWVFFNDGEYRHSLKYRVVVVEDGETREWKQDKDYDGDLVWEWYKWD